MNLCSWEPTKVKLHDGRIVDSGSVEWLTECEADWLLNQPLSFRRDYLEKITSSRGQVSVDALKKIMKSIFDQGKSK